MDIENANCKAKLSECVHNFDLDQMYIERPLKVDVQITGLERLVEELHRVFSKNHVNIQEVQKLMLSYKSDPKDWRKYAKYDRFRYTRNLVDAGNGAFNIMVLCWGPGHASAIHDHADSHCFMKLLSGNLDEVRYDWPENIEPEVMKKLKRKPTRRCCSESEDLTEEMRRMGVKCPNGNCQSNVNDSCQTDSANFDSCQNGNSDSDSCQNGGKIDQTNDEYADGYDVQSMKETGRTRLEVNDVCYINDALGLHRMENPSHVDGAVSLHLYCPPFDSCRVFDARTGKPTEVKVTFWSMYGKKIKRVMEASEIADSQQ
ncbi:cysteine dioxygenase type 1-like [Colias croceus]|uniref:cysteine dioxygenase type 1-like n=1 Tax=Colias crocea TaxID=72248 RepID=UPI001E27D439|nr:cysteine dioxygenase type 1-like [Colias croceus]